MKIISHFLGNTPVESLPKQWIARAKAWDIVKEANAPKDVFHWGGAPTHETASHNNYLSLVFPSQKFIQRVSFASDVSRPQDLIPPKHELLKTAMVAIVDGTTWDLMRPLPATAKRVEIVDFNHPLGVDTLWHSSAHILGQALEYYYRDHTVYLSDGPALKEGGYFYDLYIQVRVFSLFLLLLDMSFFAFLRFCDFAILLLLLLFFTNFFYQFFTLFHALCSSS